MSLRPLREFWQVGHPDAEEPLRTWFRLVVHAEWSKFSDVKKIFPTADQVGDKLIFNIGGNKYRLVTAIDYSRKGVLVKWIGTHQEYDKLDVKSL